MGHELEDYCKENAEYKNRASIHPHGDRPFHVPVDGEERGPRSEVRYIPEL